MRKSRHVRATGLKPAFLEAAEGIYGEAFEARNRKELADAISEWSELTDEEQRFAQAHLLYLNVQGQAALGKTMMQVRELLDEIAEDVVDLSEKTNEHKNTIREAPLEPESTEKQESETIISVG